MSFKLVAACVILIIVATAAGQPNCACPRHLAPVCGSDGQLYSNRCLLECARSVQRTDLTVQNEGPCGRRDTRAAQCACARNLAPVCGTNGVTYSNICLLNCERKRKSNLGLWHQGPCGKRNRH